MWNVRYVGCSGHGLFGMWDVDLKDAVSQLNIKNI